MENQEYKFLKDAPLFGDSYKKGQTISLNSKQARRFIDAKILEVDHPKKPANPIELSKKEG